MVNVKTLAKVRQRVVANFGSAMNERAGKMHALHETPGTGNTREVAFSVLLACRET